MATIKTEGFKVPNMPAPARHHPSRTFSDGQMTIETDILASLDRPNSISNPSPFSFSQSLPGHGLDQYMSSPHSSSINLTGGSSHGAGFSAAVFSHFKFGTDNPEPPINFPSGHESDHRSRSLSATRSSLIGKAPLNKVRPVRKNSLTDARPPSSGQGRGRPDQLHPRTMSHSDAFPNRMALGIMLDTHKEDVRTDSVSPPDLDYSGTYGTSATRHSFDTHMSWANMGSAPSLVPGSFGSYSGMNDEAITDSPITPAGPLPGLPGHLPDEEQYKKQRRRECHNQVEKRRREHINAKIEELSHLLPEHYNQVDDVVEDEEEEDATAAGKKRRNKRSGSSAKSQKDAAHCKGRILSQSVQYICDLKHVTDIQSARIRQLEAVLASQQNSSGQSNHFLWSGNGNNQSRPFGNQDDAPMSNTGNGNLEALAEHHLEVMPNSPDQDKEQRLMGFDMSADETSPQQHRRVSTLLTPESIDIDPNVAINHDGYQSSPQANDSPRMVGYQPEAKPPVSMQGMDIEAMFGVRREETAGTGMRW